MYTKKLCAKKLENFGKIYVAGVFLRVECMCACVYVVMCGVYALMGDCVGVLLRCRVIVCVRVCVCVCEYVSVCMCVGV